MMTSRQRWVLVLTSVASLMVALDALVVTTALPTIKADLHASIAQLEWTVNAYSLSFAVLLMTAAALGDRYGRRRGFAAGLALFIAASAACALAPGTGWLIAARALQGAGAAFVMPLSLSLLAAAFPPERRGAALGLFSGITGIAVLGGPVIGGAIAQGLAWQAIFWLNVPLGLVAIPLVLRHVPESRGPRVPVDGVGVLFVTGAALGIVWGLVRGNAAGWGSLEVAGALAAGAALSVGFVLWERRARAPMLPIALFRARAFSAGNAAGLLLVSSLFGAVFFMAQYLQVVGGFDPVGAGLRLLPWTATLFFVAPVAGALISRVGERALIVGGLALQAAGLAWIAAIATPGQPYGGFVVPLIIAGCGTSIAMPAAQNAVLNAVAPQAIGKASGTYNTVRQLGAVLGVAIAVAVFAGSGGYGSPAAFADGFGPALVVAAALAGAGALAGAAVPGRRSARVPVAEPAQA